MDRINSWLSAAYCGHGRVSGGKRNKTRTMHFPWQIGSGLAIRLSFDGS